MGLCCSYGADVPTTGISSELKDFNYSQSTEENYADASASFSGVHKDVRPLLDYTYHKRYLATRMEVQDEIINELFDESSAHPRKEGMLPWVVFTAGAMGVGKGYTMKWMADHGYFPIEHFVVVDPDQIRKKLPEWSGYHGRDPKTAGKMTQKESGMMAEILGFRALSQRLNIIFDGSLSCSEWYEKFIKRLRENYLGVRIMIVHVTADIDEVMARAMSRGVSEGRVVPEEHVMRSAKAVPESVQRLAESCDFVFRVVNESGREPQVAREPNAPYPPASVKLDWEMVKKLWTDIDIDGDGELSEEEVRQAVAMGILTEAVVESIDKNHDGKISKAELRSAKSMALNAR